MSYDTGFSRRTSSERDLQPVAIVAVDPTTRKATGVTRVRSTLQINCAYATGDTITTPAVGEQWYVERFDREWRLYGRIPFNDATLNIEPEQGQVSVGSASGPLELNGTEVRLNGDTVRINGVYYRDNGLTLQRSEDKITWDTVLDAVGGDGSSIQLISEALTNFTGTDQAAALQALKDWAGVLQTLSDQAPNAWGEICQNAFVDGLRRMGTGDTDLAKVVDGGQNFVDYLFGTLFCDFSGNLTPQTVLSRARDLTVPVSTRPLVKKFVQVAEKNGQGDTFLEKVFYGFENLFGGMGGGANARRVFGNLLLDPGAESAELWTAQADVVEWVGNLAVRPNPANPTGPQLPADPTHHGGGQLKIVSAGATSKMFWWNIDDLGDPEWLTTKEGEIYYAECWVRSPERNAGETSTVHLVLELKNSRTGATDIKNVTKTISQDENWKLSNKLSGYFTVPGPNQTRTRYQTAAGVEWDQIRFGFELVANQTTAGDVFFVDDMSVKEITAVQRTLKSIHEPVFGDNVEYPTYEDMQTGVFGLTFLARARHAANLLTDPKIGNSKFWTAPGLEVVQASLTTPVRSRKQSLKFTSTGSVARSFDWTVNDTGVTTPIITQADDAFYVECWVYSPLSNSSSATITIHGKAIDVGNDHTVDLEPAVSQSIVRGVWNRISGYYVIPQGTTIGSTEINYDGFVAGITLDSGDTQSGNVFYFDDLCVSEVTLAQAVAKGLGTTNHKLIFPRLLGLASLGRGRNKAGSNLLPDPKVDNAELWSGVEGLSVVSSPRRSATQSLQLVSSGTTPRSFEWMRTDTGDSTPIVAQEGDIFYVECWVRPDTGNATNVSQVAIFGKVKNSVTGTELDLTTASTTVTNPTRGVWTKISGTFTVPASGITDNSSSYDQFRVGTTVTTAANTAFNFYVDDMVVREITAATSATRLADKVTELARRKQKAGANLVLDPKIQMPASTSYWLKTGSSALSIYTYPGFPNPSYKRSGLQSLAVKVPAGGTVTFSLTLDDDGSITPLMAQNDDVFYAEVWVRTATSANVALKGRWVNSSSTIAVQDFEEEIIETLATDIIGNYPISLQSSQNWVKLSGSFTIPPETDNLGTGTADSILVQLTVSGAPNTVVYVDDILVRENTLAQNAIDNLHQGIFGGSGRHRTGNEIRLGILGLANLGRRRNKSGSNLVVDPKIEVSDLWNDYAAANSLSSVLTINTAVSAGIRSGTQSLAVTIPSSGTASFNWNIGDQGMIAPITAQNNDIFYAEAWVYASSSAVGTMVTLTAKWVKASNLSSPTPVDLSTVTGVTNLTTTTLVLGWNKLYGTFSVPSTGTGTDSVLFGLSLSGTASRVIYVDDLLVREITAANTAMSLADKVTELARRKQRSGTNLVLDPKIAMPSTTSYWLKTGNSSLSIYTYSSFPATSYKRSGLQSLAVTVPSSGTTTFALTIDDTGAITPLVAQNEDVFYAEVWVRTSSSATVTLKAKWVESSSVILSQEFEEIDPMASNIIDAYSKTLSSSQNWVKLSGSFTIPSEIDNLGTGTSNAILVELTVAGASGAVVYVDDILVRENTLAQNTIDNIHRGIFGSSAGYKTGDQIRLGILGLANLGRRRNKSGSNLVLDPKIETASSDSFWIAYAAANSLSSVLTINTSVSAGIRSGTQSLAVTIPSGGTTSFNWNVDDQGAIAPITAQNDDIFYAECWVYAPIAGTTVVLTAKRVKASNLSSPTPVDLVTATGTVNKTSTTLVLGWNKLYGTFSVPSSGTDTDSVLFGLSVTGTAGRVIYVDDILVREITAANTAARLSDKVTELARRKQKSGANLVLDPKIQMPSTTSYWLKTNNPALSIYTYSGAPATSYKRSGTQSLAITVPVSGTTILSLTLDDQGLTTPLMAQNEDVFYAEVWVRTSSSATVTLKGRWVDSLSQSYVTVQEEFQEELIDPAATDVLDQYSTQLSSSQNWVKLSGSFTIPSEIDNLGTGTADSILVQLVVSGTSGATVYVDDILVRENTLAQNVVDKIHQALTGNTGSRHNSTDRVRTGILALANLGRRRTRSGTNLVTDPKVETASSDSFWTAYAAAASLPIAVSTNAKRTGLQSLAVTVPAALSTTFNVTIDDQGNTAPITAQNDDIFYVEAWVYSATAGATVELKGRWSKTSSPTTFQTISGDSGGTFSSSASTNSSSWTKLSGTFTIPSTGVTYDSFVLAITVTGAANQVVYVDDLVIREITVAQGAASAALAANSLADKAVTLARRKQRAGANLVLDPKIAMPSTTSYWMQTGNSALSIFTGTGLPSTTYKRSGRQSLAVTIPAAGTTVFALTLDDDGDPVPLAAQNDDIFYAEVWIKTATSATVTLTGKWMDSTGNEASTVTLASYPKSLTSSDNWYELSGSFTIPSESDSNTGNYDSLLVELTVAGTASRVVYVDDILVRENTLAQNTINNIHQAFNGSTAGTSGTPAGLKTLFENLNKSLYRKHLLPGYSAGGALFGGDSETIALDAVPPLDRSKVLDLKNTLIRIHHAITGNNLADVSPDDLYNGTKGSMFSLASLGRRRTRSGTNLVTDPKIETASGASFWTDYATKNSLPIAVSGTAFRTGSQSLAVTVPAGLTTTFNMVIEDQGVVAPVAAQNGDIFYVECWAYSATSNTVTLGGRWAKSSNLNSFSSLTGTAVDTLSATVSTNSSSWTKLSGTFTIPSTGTTYDSFVPLITVTGAANQVVYIDDMLVREITDAQNTVDNIHKAFGGTGSGTSGGLKTWFENLNKSLYRRHLLPGYTAGISPLFPGDTATIDYEAVPELDRGKIPNLKDTIDAIHQAISGIATPTPGDVNQSPSKVKDGVSLLLNSLFNGIKGRNANTALTYGVGDVNTANIDIAAAVASLSKTSTQSSTNTGGTLGGSSYFVDFTARAYPVSAPYGTTLSYTYPSGVTETFNQTNGLITYSTTSAGSFASVAGTGTGFFGVSGGTAQVLGASLNADNKDSWAIWSQQTQTIYQKVGICCSTAPSAAPLRTTPEAFNYIVVRSDSTGSNCVYAKIGESSCEIWRVVNNAHTRTAAYSGTFRFRTGANYWLAAGNYANGKQSRFTLYENANSILSVDDTLASTTNKYVGLGVSWKTFSLGLLPSQMLPGKILAWAAFDDKPADTLGCGFRITRASGTTYISGTDAAFASGFFDTATKVATADFAATNQVRSNGSFVCALSGWYYVEARIGLTTATGTANQLSLKIDDVIVARGPLAAKNTDLAGAQTLTASWIVYLRKGQLGAIAYTASGTASTGSNYATVTNSTDQTYLTVAFLNNQRPTDPTLSTTAAVADDGTDYSSGLSYGIDWTP